MKRLLFIFFALASLLLSSCRKEVEEVVPVDPTQELLEEILSEPEMPVRIWVDGPEGAFPDADTKASIVGGTESGTEATGGYITSIKMLCFYKQGSSSVYIGTRDANLVGDEEQFETGHPGHNEWGRKLLTGTVPGRTNRVHFVANVDASKIPTTIGGDEFAIINNMSMTMGLEDTQISYWGFHGEATPTLMQRWLAQEDEQGHFEQREGSVVHFIRDRAKLTFHTMTDISVVDPVLTGSNDHEYRILSIAWIAVNGLNRGYVAPYNPNDPDEPYDNYYEYDTTESKWTLNEDHHAPYYGSGAARYTATEADMMEVYNYNNGNPVIRDGFDQTIFLYEDDNLSDPEQNDPLHYTPIKLILRVDYLKDCNGADIASNRIRKYHVMLMLNKNLEHCVIHRNHSYQLNIHGLPWEGLGVSTFEAALLSEDYANNRTINISDNVINVNNGKFELAVDDSYLIYQDPADQEQYKTVNFKYVHAEGEPNAGQGVAGLTTSKFKAEWVNAPFPSFADPTVEITSYNTSTGDGTLRFKLGTAITSTLQGGRIHLTDLNSGLSRFINVYTISKFSYLPDGVAQDEFLLEIVPGVTREVNSVTCQTFKLDFRIPGNYPLGLYPLVTRMASRTLNPYAVYRDGVLLDDVEIGIEMAPTENGESLDGEILGGMSFQNSDANKWNYRATGTPWNYWFTYTQVAKLTKEVGDETVEDTDDHLYTIYFDDVRELRAAGNQSEDIGLFFKIKYFGDAVAVTE